jgi:hypothetical protein
MNNKERFALADRIQKKIQNNSPYLRLIKRRDEIEKELKEKNENRRS